MKDSKAKGIKEMSVEEGLVASLSELRDALQDGGKIEEKFTMRTVDLRLEPHDYEPEDVKRVRDKLGASQTVFARLLGVKARTVQSWEQGLVPPAMARRLLDLIDEEPDRWRKVLREAAKDKAAL